MSKKGPYIFVILGMITFFLAEPLAAQAAALDQAIMFNVFLATWIDAIFYILTVIFISLGLSNLEF